jgi:hypothetical protein
VVVKVFYVFSITLFADACSADADAYEFNKAVNKY